MSMFARPLVFVFAVALGWSCAPQGEPCPDSPHRAGCPEPDPFATSVRLTPRVVLDAELENARDLGGTPLAEGAVAPGVLFRGPPLNPLGEHGCAELGELGIRTIVDLRVESERLLKPEDPCALEQARLLLAPLPVPYSVSTSDYIADLNAIDSMASVFQALGDEAAYPLYLHCTWGRDRTGVVSALILLSLGANRETVLAEYLLSHETVGATPRSLLGMLDALEAQGGIDAYLERIGVTPEALDVLRARAVQL